MPAQTTSLLCHHSKSRPTNHPQFGSPSGIPKHLLSAVLACALQHTRLTSHMPGVLDSGRKLLGKNYSRKLLNHQGSKPLKQTKFWAKNSGHNLLSISQVLPVPSRLTSGIRHHLAHSEEGRSSRSPTKATGQNRQSWQCGTADCTEKTS